jgi:hypothetical protein
MAHVSERTPVDYKDGYNVDDRREDGSARHEINDGDAEFGGPEERARMERSLLRRLDLRHSILILIYILNYVSVWNHHLAIVLIGIFRLTVTMPRQCPCLVSPR